MLNTFVCSIAEVEITNADPQLLTYLENYCITQIGKDRLANTKVGSYPYLKIAYLGNQSIQQSFESD